MELFKRIKQPLISSNFSFLPYINHYDEPIPIMFLPLFIDDFPTLSGIRVQLQNERLQVSTAKKIQVRLRHRVTHHIATSRRPSLESVTGWLHE
jgi:hypothetical protein